MEALEGMAVSYAQKLRAMPLPSVLELSITLDRDVSILRNADEAFLRAYFGGSSVTVNSVAEFNAFDQALSAVLEEHLQGSLSGRVRAVVEKQSKNIQGRLDDPGALRDQLIYDALSLVLVRTHALRQKTRAPVDYKGWQKEYEISGGVSVRSIGTNLTEMVWRESSEVKRIALCNPQPIVITSGKLWWKKMRSLPPLDTPIVVLRDSMRNYLARGQEHWFDHVKNYARGDPIHSEGGNQLVDLSTVREFYDREAAGCANDRDRLATFQRFIKDLMAVPTAMEATLGYQLSHLAEAKQGLLRAASLVHVRYKA